MALAKGGLGQKEVLNSEAQPSEGKRRIILAVDLDYFYAQCEEIRKPELKDKPIVICVFSGRSETSGAVSTTNYLARRLGVKSGIPISTAMRILRDESEAVFLPMDTEYYENVSDRVMQSLKKLSNSFEQVSVDEAFLDVSQSSLGSFENAEEIARKIKEEILQSEKLTCTIGVATNKLLAKMSADSSKPDGLKVLEPSEVGSFLENLPVEKLIGIGPKTGGKLNELGIRTVGELAGFSQTILAETLGNNLGPQLRRMAQGLDDSPVEQRQIHQLSRIITLKKNAGQFDFKSDLEPLSKNISERMKSMSLMCSNVGVIIITSELKTKNRARALNILTDSENEILSIASDLFQSFFAEAENRDVKARRIGIRVSGFSKKIELSQGFKEGSLTEFLA